MLQAVESELQQPISIQLAFSCDICMPIYMDMLQVSPSGAVQRTRYIDISEEQLFGSCCFLMIMQCMPADCKIKGVKQCRSAPPAQMLLASDW